MSPQRLPALRNLRFKVSPLARLSLLPRDPLLPTNNHFRHLSRLGLLVGMKVDGEAIRGESERRRTRHLTTC